ncbi:hypothetical protein [Paraglaciecola sp.]|uniref:hypothetical protein n=1 Tax=Paraglaciecola sp. TaxID=1920173 RepID=UPI003EF34C44
MNIQFTIALILAVFSLFTACSKDIPADPMCRIQAQQKTLPPAPAACLIKLNGKLLAIETLKEKTWSVPIEKQNKDQSAQCSAHQAAWNSTGLNVEIRELLFVSQNNTHYFACTANNPLGETEVQLPVPAWSKHKINKIQLVNPYETRPQDWSAAFDLVKIRDAFTRLQPK